MKEREWDTHAPNVEARQCTYCGEEFYLTHQSQRYCEKHREPKYGMRASRGISDTKQVRCRVCGCSFEVTVRKGAVRNICGECRKPKPAGIDKIGSSSWALATRDSASAASVLYSSKVDIAQMPSTWDDEHAQIEWLARQDQETIMRDLNNHEVVYARSVTERHQHPFVLLRLIVAVENVSDKNRGKEMYWAVHKLQEMNGFHVETPVDGSVERVWADPPTREREQWVVNIMARFERIE